MLVAMGKNTWAIAALLLTMLYGALFAVIGEDIRTPYAVIGGVLVAAAWILVGVTRSRGELD